MTIWLLAVLLLASLAGIGFRQGAIRVGISFVGILMGALLAVPLGRLIRPIVGAVGVKDPILAWVLPPLIMFILISVLFKAVAAVVHQKVDVYYKYRAGDLRLALWERLNRRLGLCLGLLNAVAYIVLISFVIHAFSYWTVQLASDDDDPRMVRLLNRMGRDLQSTGMNKAARSVDGLSPRFYEGADIAGLLYNNALLEARLSSYPAFLGLGERGEFQALGTDREFLDMRHRRDPIQKLLSHAPVKSIVDNPETMRTVWNTVVPDLKDLRVYLETGKSPKYSSETILGRWNFNVSAALSTMRRNRPNISSTEMQRIKKWMVAAFDKTSMVAMTDNTTILKNVPQLKAPAAGTAPAGPETLTGKWQSLEPNKYRLEFSDSEGVTGTIEGDRLTLRMSGTDLVFTRQS
ncbi:MAG TPA: hypothetical protein VN673_17275 [Clostridia bacterium]|nr:hypothetical protein [Clostridia bacterium]